MTPTVVLLHAFPLDPRMWDDVAGALATDGIPVAAPRLGPEPSMEPWAARILAETDSPYLAPQPVRGRPNEPANVMHTLATLAEARGEDAAELERAIDANATAAFGLP